MIRLKTLQGSGGGGVENVLNDLSRSLRDLTLSAWANIFGSWGGEGVPTP